MAQRTLSFALVLGVVIGLPLASGQSVDPRSAEGQLQVCGGAAAWQRVAFLEFEVRIETPQATRGPWLYQWARREGYMAMAGPAEDGSQLNVAIELNSRTGGGWRGGVQLTGKALAESVSWALARFMEDVLWLTFPLEWGAANVTVRPLEPITGEDQVSRPAVEVRSPAGTWTCLLDPESGRIYQTVFSRPGMGSYTAIWEDWRPHAGVLFAGKRRILETGETILVDVKRALPQIPPSAF